MINVGLIPLDSRPCNTQWVVDLGLIGGSNIIMYPRNKCGNLHFGAKLDDMLDWLEKNAEKMDYLIISSDGLSFGGLIQARLAQIDLEKTIDKINVLRNIKARFPNLKMYMFDTVMRTSITAFDEETERYWAKVNRYSCLKGRIHFFNDKKNALELAELEKEIPQHIIDTYWHARSIKHSLNKYFISLVNEGVLDSMILLQEDSMAYGVQKIEQEILEKIIDENNLSDKIQFYNGTDEGACVLLGKILVENKKIKPKYYLHVPSHDVIEKCFLFEDRPFTENIEKMCQTIGFNLTSNVDDADFILSIFAEKENIDLDIACFKEMPINKNEEYYRYINELNSFISEKKKVVLVDLFFPNGGSYELLEDVNYRDLTVYSSWNTASNSLGSALCQIAAVLCNDKENELNKKFVYERVIDDCIYQYFVRRKVNEVLLAQEINIHDLQDNYDYALNLVKEQLKKYEHVIDNQEYDIVLPWKRMFEVEIIIK